MLNPQQTNVPAKDCWQQLLQLHKSLAELEMINTQGWEFLGQAHRLPSTADTTRSKSIDPESWRKRAQEARALAGVTADAIAMRSYLDIADAYDTLADAPS
jgi:hypothetical protein